MSTPTKITVNSNGSLKIEGEFVITDSQGNEYGLQGRTNVGICRCGLSNNKPFSFIVFRTTNKIIIHKMLKITFNSI